ncbi:MAG: helix-turn-helix domain-containing protein [Oscillospiraceae bacterium]|nr:helix-turn-helix domain-containing protein [Oscillospiraceae bacterium]
MNNISISKTADGTKKYPLHKHSNWEIMYYLSGEGHLATEGQNIPFQKGSIIVVPPSVMHGSVSQNGFVNISVGGDFNHLFMFDNPVLLYDNSRGEGERLSNLIYENRFAQSEYLSALCSAYVHFLLQNIECENRVSEALGQIIKAATENFSDAEFNITDSLNKSGYAEDYIRTKFKDKTGLSPIAFLTNVRITHAKKLFEIYSNSISVSQAAEKCGFDDLIYFSKRFKQVVGVSPDRYRKEMLKTVEKRK